MALDRPPPRSLDLRPSRGLAALWAVLGVAGATATAWVIADSQGAVLAWVLLVAIIVLTGVISVPLVAPDLVTLHLDEDGLHGRVYGRAVEARWDDVAVARITTVAGEPILVLHERDPATRPPATGAAPTTSRGVLLPVGADLDQLDRFLAHRLGRRAVQP